MAQPAGTYTPPTGPRIRFEVIGEAWGELMRNMSAWIVAMLFAVIVLGGAYLIGYLVVLLPLFFTQGSDVGVIATFGGFAVFGVAMIVLMGAIYGGLYRMAIRQLRGEMPTAGDLFQSFDLAPRMIGVHLLVTVLMMVGFFLCVIPGFIVMGLTFLAYAIVADQNVGSVEAIRMSWEALKKDTLMAILFALVVSILAQIGVYACVVGALFTGPLMFLSHAIVYRDFFPERFASQSAPPPGAPAPPAEPPTQPGA